MALELCHTSVPRGLKPGSSGFCTVALTGGMPGPMIQRLETLSGYRPIYPVGSPDASKNPAEFAHWQVSVGGRYYSVLSYVCFAGADHQGRSNKFAHHVALDPDEQISAGPAWLMMQPGILMRSWSGTPRTMPPTRIVSDGPNPPRPCTAWESLTGDAGWAGLLIDAFLLDASKPAYVLYEPGTEVLPLVAEAMALLPPRMRWRVTFSTYFQSVPAGLSCSWRFCAAGSPAANLAPNNATSGVLIDLTRNRFGMAPDSRYVIAARTGQPPIVSEAAAVYATEGKALSPPVARVGPAGSIFADCDGEFFAGSAQPQELADGLCAEPEGPYVAAAGTSEPLLRRSLLWVFAAAWPLLVVLAMWLIWRDRPSPGALDALRTELAEAKRQATTFARASEETAQKLKRIEQARDGASEELAKLREDHEKLGESYEKLRNRLVDIEIAKNAPPRLPDSSAATETEPKSPLPATNGRAERPVVQNHPAAVGPVAEATPKAVPRQFLEYQRWSGGVAGASARTPGGPRIQKAFAGLNAERLAERLPYEQPKEFQFRRIPENGTLELVGPSETRIATIGWKDGVLTWEWVPFSTQLIQGSEAYLDGLARNASFVLLDNKGTPLLQVQFKPDVEALRVGDKGVTWASPLLCDVTVEVASYSNGWTQTRPHADRLDFEGKYSTLSVEARKPKTRASGMAEEIEISAKWDTTRWPAPRRDGSRPPAPETITVASLRAQLESLRAALADVNPADVEMQLKENRQTMKDKEKTVANLVKQLGTGTANAQRSGANEHGKPLSRAERWNLQGELDDVRAEVAMLKEKIGILDEQKKQMEEMQHLGDVVAEIDAVELELRLVTKKNGVIVKRIILKGGSI